MLPSLSIRKSCCRDTEQTHRNCVAEREKTRAQQQELCVQRDHQLRAEHVATDTACVSGVMNLKSLCLWSGAGDLPSSHKLQTHELNPLP